MEVLVGAFNQEKALVGAFSVIVKTDGSFAALVSISVACQGIVFPQITAAATSSQRQVCRMWKHQTVVFLFSQIPAPTNFATTALKCLNPSKIRKICFVHCANLLPVTLQMLAIILAK